MAENIPNEIWIYIFHLATDGDPHLDELPHSFDNSSWFLSIFHVWSLQSPEELAISAQKKRYRTIRAILSTCTNWNQIGREFLYKSVSIFRPSELQKICSAFDRDTALGWWTKRISLAGSGVANEDTLNLLVYIIRHCPNIDTMTITGSWPLSSTLCAAIADALLTYTSRSLHTLSWHIPLTSLPKTIWAINSLSKSLQFLYLEFTNSDKEEALNLGSGANLNLTLPELRRLSLRGSFQEFLEVCSEWIMPSLERVSFDFVNSRDDLPDVLEFLVHHGSNLTFLDLNCLPTLDVASILDLCPQLKTFAFNPDWRLPYTDDFLNVAKLVNRPHPNITHIGLHQLMYAFGVGLAATYTEVDPFSTIYIRQSNDLNFAALTKTNFPSLKCIRLLSRALLSELDAADGPHEDCMPRWERWWDQCVKQGVRLEDCTGAYFGTLPNEEEEEEEDDDDDDEAEEYSGGGVGGNGVPLSELRELLEECRRMSIVDQDESDFVVNLQTRY